MSKITDIIDVLKANARDRQTINLLNELEHEIYLLVKQHNEVVETADIMAEAIKNSSNEIDVLTNKFKELQEKVDTIDKTLDKEVDDMLEVSVKDSEELVQ